MYIDLPEISLVCLAVCWVEVVLSFSLFSGNTFRLIVIDDVVAVEAPAPPAGIVGIVAVFVEPLT